MDIPHWLTGPAFIAAIAAIFSSLIPILAKVVKEYVSRRSSQNLIITLGNGNKVSIEGKSLDAANIQEIIKALEVAKPPDAGASHE